MGITRQRYELVVDRITGYDRGKVRGNFVGEVGLEIHEIFAEHSRPDHIQTVDVRFGRSRPK